MASMSTLFLLLFWVWMFYDCCKYEKREVSFGWMLVLALLSFVGALLYGIVRWLPRMAKAKWCVARPSAVEHELRRAIADARNIGNAHQFVRLGQLYQKAGKGGDALAAYQRALKKDPHAIEPI